MAELKYDPRNYRIHTDKNKRLIRKSLEDCGAGRSILFDKDDCIIAGNGVYEQALELGLPVRIVESDGTELIAIKRTDLSTEDSRRKALALADNYTSDTSVFDFDAIVEDFSADELDAWEFKIDDLNIDDISIDDVKPDKGRVGSLKERFIIPPFSVLDSKLGNWQDRKRAWLDLGIKSDDGREKEITFSRSAQPPRVYEARNVIREKQVPIRRGTNCRSIAGIMVSRLWMEPRSLTRYCASWPTGGLIFPMVVSWTHLLVAPFVVLLHLCWI